MNCITEIIMGVAGILSVVVFIIALVFQKEDTKKKKKTKKENDNRKGPSAPGGWCAI